MHRPPRTARPTRTLTTTSPFPSSTATCEDRLWTSIRGASVVTPGRWCVRQRFTYADLPGCRSRRQQGWYAPLSASFVLGPVSTTRSPARNTRRPLAPLTCLTLAWRSRISIESTRDYSLLCQVLAVIGAREVWSLLNRVDLSPDIAGPKERVEETQSGRYPFALDSKEGRLNEP